MANSLEAGLAALKAKDYLAAIAHLEPIAETQPNQPSGFQAQMGLVVAYQKTGQVKRAIALCSTLTKNPNEQIKTWADRTLKTLVKRHLPQQATAPLPPPPPNRLKHPETQQLTDPTGFVPFNQPATPPSPVPPPPSDLTGFVPLDPTATPKPTKPNSVSPPPLLTRQLPSGPTTDRPPAVEPPATSSEVDPTASTLLDFPKSAGTSPQTSEFSENTSPTSLPYQLTWRQAGRVQKWRPLKALNFTRFWFEQALTAIAFFWLTLYVVRFLELTLNDFLVRLPYLEPIQIFYRDPTLFLYTACLLLLVLSPWLMDGLLKLCYGLQPLPLTTLFNCSQEANRVLRNFTSKTGKPIPTLKILPISAPFAITYGCLPRFARIVVSQGLLDRLAEDEIATIYARELGHIAHWDFVLMSLATLILQIPYTLYWQVAGWGERVKDLSEQLLPAFMKPALPYGIAFLRGVMAGVAALNYGIFWLLRWPMLWVSRRRVFYSDRFAVEATGNPNGLTRALAKIAIGMAEDVQQQQQTSTLLEGFELLMPLGYNQAVVLGSVACQTPLEPILQWDLSNPERYWLVMNQTHPLLGERLQLLAIYAQYWKLETEFDLVSQESGEQKQKKKLSLTLPQRLLLQGAPFFGIPMSLALVGAIWVMGGIFSVLNIWQLDWLWGDRGILLGCLPIGFSLGTFFRFNHYFPDIQPFGVKEPSLPTILSNPAAIPLDSQPVRLQGELLGRRGMSNWLGQDLMLQTTTGLVRLHHVSILGPVGNLWPVSTRPSDLVGKTVVATGWLRRGATPWIDVESVKAQGGRTSYSNHPIWSTIVACVAACWGAYTIFRGGA
ncbi:MAG: M48 family metalloprotease [Actinomycetota bacterium]